MGNSTSQYERHEDDEQQQRLVINREFRLVLGQLDLSSDLIKSKKTLLNNSNSSNGKQPRHRKISSSSSNSTITSSSSSDHPLSSISLVHLDIPTSSFDSNELDTHALLQYLLHHESYGKELSHLFRLPSTTTAASNPKSRSKSLPTAKIVAVYYDQPSTTNEFSIETIPLFNENEFEGKCQQFYHTSILSIYTSSRSRDANTEPLLLCKKNRKKKKRDNSRAFSLLKNQRLISSLPKRRRTIPSTNSCVQRPCRRPRSRTSSGSIRSSTCPRAAIVCAGSFRSSTRPRRARSRSTGCSNVVRVARVTRTSTASSSIN